MKPCTLELGGKNPLIICDDADIDFAVNTSAFGTFMHQGQICMCAGRIIVDEKIADEFTKKLAAKAATLPAGNPKEPSTVVGPLINDKAVAKVDSLVKDAVANGAKLLAGGTFEGRVYKPTGPERGHEKDAYLYGGDIRACCFDHHGEERQRGS
jgi:acyl-CoA reductase-like NAD-dependent aldehyde dehydrogenase